MTKLTLDIDISDKDDCTLGIRRLWTALIDHHGEGVAFELWRKNKDLNEARRIAFIEASSDFKDAIREMSYGNQCLVLGYFAMPKPSKRGLAKMLAAKLPMSVIEIFLNNSAPDRLHQRVFHGKSGQLESILRQINRVFSDYPQQCDVIGATPLALRQEALRYAEMMAGSEAAKRGEGLVLKQSPERPARMTKKRRAVIR